MDLSTSLTQTLFVLIGVALNAAAFMLCYARSGKSFLRTVSSVSIPSIVLAVAVASLFRIDNLGDWAEPLLLGFGGAGAVATFAAWVTLSTPPSSSN
jgi:hypothetical protein